MIPLSESGSPLLDRHALPRLGATVADAKERVGEIVAAHRLAQDCLILLGWSADRIAEDGLATLENGKRERGRFRAAFWPRTDKAEGWFVAALRLPEIGDAASGARLRLSGPGARNPMIACLPPATADCHGFAAELAVRLGGEIDLAAQFLLETFGNRASRQLETVSRFLGAVIDVAAEEDGVVEILGPLDGEGLLVQGWARHLRAGTQHLLAAGAVLAQHDTVAATFSRGDLEAPALGFLAIIRANEAGLASAPTRLYLRSGNRFRRLAVLPTVTKLSPDESVGQLRGMLGALQGEQSVMAALRNAARPRFDGHDTVTTLDRAVRMAVDLAAYVEGSAWYLTGWLLDPASEVQSVTLRGPDGFEERLDTRWTRVPRPDVSNGFTATPPFAGRIGHDMHGFTVCVPYFTSRHAWLELRLNHEHSAFMPLAPRPIEGWSGRLALLNSFDLHKPSASEIVERQLGPFLHAAKAGRRRAVAHRVLRAGAASGDQARAALIVPLVDPALRTNIIIAGLASRPPGGGVAPLLVCSPELGDKMATLLREIDFYGLDAAIVLADEPVDHCEALELGVRATRAPCLVFLAPTAHSLHADWAVPLLEALAGGAAAASPTLLYEDWSIRYAGADGLAFQVAAPYATAAIGRAGYPRGAVADRAPCATLAGALDCCAIARTAFDEIGGFSPGYTLAAAGGVDLFLRLSAAGRRILWVPGAELYALDEAGAPERYWQRTGELVDGWSLRASWEGRLPALPAEPVHPPTRSRAAAPAGSR